MAKEFAKKFYASKEWRQCRKSFFTIKHGICQRCGGPGKIVHHKEHLTPNNINDPTIALNHDMLELHCQDCHNKEHNEKYGVTVEGVMFDANGDLVRSDIS